MQARMIGKLACLCVSGLLFCTGMPMLSAVMSKGPVGTGDFTAGILWWHDLNAPSFGSASVGDIDEDGRPEVVFGTYFNDEHVYALNAEDGSLLWWYDTGGCNDASSAIADVDGDGHLEVVVPGSSACVVFCFNGATGAVKWSRSLGYSLDSPPAVADVDGDGRPEVLLGSYGGYIFCLKGEDGTVQWQRNVGTNSYIQSCPTVLDLNGDGLLEVVVAQWAGDDRVYALRGSNGSTVWFSDLPNDYMYHGPSFGDVDGDGLPELAIGCYDNHVYVLNGEDGSLCWAYAASWYVGAPTCLGDLNNDGFLEVVFVAYNMVGVLSHTGSLLWSYATGGNVFRGVAIADVDGNGVLDVAFGCDDGIVRVLRGDSGAVVWTYDLQAHYGQVFEMDHAPVLADLNGDGMLDLFVVGGHGESSPHPENNHGRAYALSAGVGTGAGWRMFHHDLVHSGRYQVGENQPPVPGGGSGPWMGRPGVNYTFCVNITDPDGDAVFCDWNFGDGSTSGWLGPYPSGSSCCVMHAWATEGVFEVRVRLRDDEGAVSGWYVVCNITIDGSAPALSLVRPDGRRVYLGDRLSFPFILTVLVGSVTVEATAQDPVSGVARVEFLVDGVVASIDESAPYEMVWEHGWMEGRHKLRVAAYDTVGNWGELEDVVVWKLL